MSRKCLGLVCPKPNGTAVLSLVFQSFWILWEDMLRSDGVHRLGALGGLGARCLIAGLARPDVEAAMMTDGDFPGAPNAFALAKAAVEDVVGANIGLGPIALARGRIVAAFDEKA